MMKKIFIIDFALVPLFLLTASTGIGLHLAGHGSNHELWHNWAVAHVVMSVLFMIGVVYHVGTHKMWYKGIVKNGVGKKNRVTAVVSVLFAVVTLTGLALLGIDGANSGVGLWHYRFGLLATVFFAGHIAKRTSTLRKVFNLFRGTGIK